MSGHFGRRADHALGYIVWEASRWVSLGTDTILVRDGKTRMQTFAAHPAVDWTAR